MSAKQKYWLTEPRSAFVLFIGFATMALLEDTAISLSVGAITVVLAVLVFTLVDRKNAQKLDNR